jgi:hypothetical protein
MANTTTRSILAGALAAGLVLAAPLAANAAATSHLPSVAQFEDTEIPSTKADLKQYASVLAGTPVYSEPSADASHLLPQTAATGLAPDQIRAAGPFTATSDSWVAVQIPDAAHGLDSANSTLAEVGVGYIRATSVSFQAFYSDGPTEDPPAADAYPQKASDLVTTTHLGGSVGLYSKPIESREHALNAETNKWGSSLKSSEMFTYEGKEWVAIESSVPGGIAYISADKRFATVEPVKAQASAAPEATSSATPSAEPSPSAVVPAAETSSDLPQPNSFLNALSKGPAVLFAAMVMAATLFIAKRRTV